MDLNKDKKNEHFEQLKNQEQKLDEKIELLERKISDKEKIIKYLHDYNDIKDATQVVLGQLADMYGVTVTSLHEKYDLMNEI